MLRTARAAPASPSTTMPATGSRVVCGVSRNGAARGGEDAAGHAGGTPCRGPGEEHDRRLDHGVLEDVAGRAPEGFEDGDVPGALHGPHRQERHDDQG